MGLLNMRMGNYELAKSTFMGIESPSSFMHCRVLTNLIILSLKQAEYQKIESIL